MFSYEFNGQNPKFLTSNGFKNNHFYSSQERIFFYENTKFLWKELMKINTTYIMKTKDISLIEPYVENILYTKLKIDDIDLLSNEYIIQLVILIQLTGQYLVYTQKRLEFENQELREKIYELEVNMKDSEKYQTIIDNLNRQNQEKDFMIKTYQNMMSNRNGITSLKNINNGNDVIENKTHNENKNILKNKKEGKIYYCKICSGKGFYTKKLLDEHIQRRHYEIIDIESNNDYQEEKEIEIINNNYKEIFDKKINALKEYFEKMVQQSKEANEFNLLNKKFDFLSNQIILQNTAKINNNNQNGICENCKRNINDLSKKNLPVNKKEQNIKEKNKLELENAKEINKLKEESNRQVEINNELNKILKERNNEIEKLKIQMKNMNNLNNMNPSNINKETTVKKTVINEKTYMFLNNNENEEKQREFNLLNSNENKNNNDIKKSDSYKNDFIPFNGNSSNDNNNVLKNQLSYNGNDKIFTNTGDTDQDNLNKMKEIQNQKDIDNGNIKININNEKKNSNEQNKLKDKNKNVINETDEKKDEKNPFKTDIVEKNQKSNNVQEESDLKKEENINLSLLQKKIIKRDEEFYNQKINDDEIEEEYKKINEITLKYKNDNEKNEKLEQIVQNNIEDKNLDELIGTYERNKNNNVKGKDIYRIIGLDKILEEYNIYKATKNKNNIPDNKYKDEINNTPGNEGDINNVNNNNKRQYSLKSSNIEDTKVKQTINVDENKNYYSRQNSNITHSNPRISNPRLSTQNEKINEDKINELENSNEMVKENEKKKTGIIQNSIINYDLTQSNF